MNLTFYASRVKLRQTFELDLILVAYRVATIDKQITTYLSLQVII